MFPEISLSEAFQDHRLRPGICIGRGATCHSTAYEDAKSSAVASLEVSSASAKDILSEISPKEFSFLLDDLKARSPDLAHELRQRTVENLRKLTSPLDLPHLATIGWSACISLTQDCLFESVLRNHLDTKPQSIPMTMVDSIDTIVSTRSIPVYKLLGNLESRNVDSELALSAAEILIRQNRWSALLRSCPDHMRGAPLFFLGTYPELDLCRRLLTQIVAHDKPGYSRLYFTKSDPILNDPTVAALLSQADTRVVDATLRELCNHLAQATRLVKKSSEVASTGSAAVTLAGLTAELQTFVSVVPSHKPLASELASHLPQNIDALFRPASVDWSPYLHDLDLRRSHTTGFCDGILGRLSEPKTTRTFALVRGDAAVGKTSFLKRIGIELAANGVYTLWCRRALLGSWTRVFRKFAKDLQQIEENKRKELRVALLCDDPWSLRMDARELMACFDGIAVRITFVFALRNSDYFTADRLDSTIGVRPDVDLELPYELDPEEISNLKLLLTRIGICQDTAGADSLVKNIHSTRSKDILCSLWYLVPETRFQLSESLRDEYSRLGEIREKVESVAQYAVTTSAVARKAYEFVTVTSSLGLGLPIEVLVHALNIEYDEWLDMSRDGRPLWGLLYDEADSERQTITFWTRNEVVTRILLELVNGGISSHAGEMRVLNELISACRGGALVYREFIVDLLVRARSRLESRLSYLQGIELYDIAKRTLPYGDRVLEHHKGIWMQNKGGAKYRAAAHTQLELALSAPLYPGSTRDAPLEHIHTSLAANTVQRVKDGELAPEVGLEIVQEHVRQASSPKFFNPHTSHVIANIFFELAMQHKNKQDIPFATAISEAFTAIDRALQTIGTSSRAAGYYEKDITMLNDVQRKILTAIPNTTDLEALAEQLFTKKRSQIGFAVAAKRLLSEAMLTDRGRGFNAVRQYLEGVREKIKATNQPVEAEIDAIEADLIIAWQLNRIAGPIDWIQLLSLLESALRAVKYIDDPAKTFYRAVCFFHLGRFTDATATFSAFRRGVLSQVLPAEVRCCYRGSEGMPKRVQGTFEHKHMQSYLYIPELGISVLSQRSSIQGGHGTTTHAYIVFALNGPLAVYDRPEY